MSKSQAVREYFKKHPNAAPTDALAELSKQGVDVSYALVCKVKSRLGQRTSQHRSRRKTVSAAANGNRNGSAEGPTKAQAIRDTIKELGRRARPRDVIAALSDKGITVSSAQVSIVRRQLGLKKRRRQKAAPINSGSERSVSGTISVSDLIAAKRLADSMGGVKLARKAIEALERLS